MRPEGGLVEVFPPDINISCIPPLMGPCRPDASDLPCCPTSETGDAHPGPLRATQASRQC